MSRKFLALLAAALALVFAPAPAFAQLDNALTKPDCNSTTYPSGVTRQIVQTTAGLVCTSASATGTFTDDATGVTGNAPPASASYTGLNISSLLRGWTGVNPSGSIFAGQIDITSVAGAIVKTGHGTASGAERFELPTDGTGQVFQGAYSFANITTATTTTPKSGAGMVHTICVNSLGTVASTITAYDNTAASGTKIATINSLALLGCQTYDVAFATGLTIVTTGTVAPDVTVSLR